MGGRWENGATLELEAKRLMSKVGLADHMECVGSPPWTTMRIRGFGESETLGLRSYFQQECIKRGILTHGSHVLSVAHDNSVIQEALQAYSEVLPLIAEAIDDGGVLNRLEGPPVRPILRS